MQSSIVRASSRLLIVAVLFVVSSYCHSPSEPAACLDQTVVLANDPEYLAKSEPLTPGNGHLTKNCSANARYCYYFGGGAAPIYTKGNQTVLDAFVDKDVVIVGKIVAAPSGSSSAGELWPGTICRLRI